MTAVDALAIALMIIVLFGLGTAPLLLPRAYLRPWGPLLSLALLLGAAWLMVALREAPHPYHYAALIPFGIGWLLGVLLMPIRLRRE